VIDPNRRSDNSLAPEAPSLPIRVLDVLGSGVAIAATLPLWPVIAIAVKVSSPGPVFYRAARLGAGARPFVMFKFRTMRVGSDRGLAITVGGDARVTAVGRMLRRTKLDELPQFLNVLRGEMGLVGPRPESPAYLDAFPDALRDVLRYRPGITGPASIAYRHEEELLHPQGDLSPDALERFYVEQVLPAKAKLDLDYCRTRSVRSDIHVLADTVRGLIGRGGTRP
jgi:lipopolysaccharide/colanic/teichoic acid biosynthesis glycosyltransferase